MNILVWLIACAAIAGVILRPFRWPEAVWACAGAALLIALGLIPPRAAFAAVAQGADVYLFLTGMMLLSEIARRDGVFDWLASHAVHAAGGSRTRLFTLLYAVGVLVTVFLSNDATAVVLTPAVYAAVRRARVDALTYLFICAFIANAASFVLPISNPANLVVYGKALPPLWTWLRTFFLPSLCAIAATYVALRFVVRHELRGASQPPGDACCLSQEGRRAAYGIAASAAALMTASALDWNLGFPTCIAAFFTLLAASRLRLQPIRQITAGVAWSVLPLVAGLFVLVAALDRAGALVHATRALSQLSAMPRAEGAIAASFGIAALSNLMNNLPSGLLAGGALHAFSAPESIRNSILIGVDLGPNLSVTGSLATILWLIALRREGVEITAARFLKVGAIVMPPALLLAALSVTVL
jgi:arsenical pump membrane protein